MAGNLLTTGEWVEISDDDYIDEATADGRPLTAIMRVEDLFTGRTEYYGILDEVEEV